MAWFQLRFHRDTVTRSGPNQVAYRVTASIDAAAGIPAELFVARTDDEGYDHVAQVYDLLTFPASKALALNPDAASDFFRTASATQTFDRPAGVEMFVAYVKETLQATLRHWGAHTGALVGPDEVVVYASTTP